MAELRTEQEFKDLKLPYVKAEYGVINPMSGKVIEVDSIDYAKTLKGLIADSMIVRRHVSEWLEYKP